MVSNAMNLLIHQVQVIPFKISRCFEEKRGFEDMFHILNGLYETHFIREIYQQRNRLERSTRYTWMKSI